MARSSAGNTQVVLLLLLLLGAAGAGAWNYQRNVELEKQVMRPYRGISDAELGSLRSAYEAEIEEFRRRYEQLSGYRPQVRDGRYFDQKVDEFERVQKVSVQVRAIGRELAEREGDLQRIAQEETLREGERDKLKLFLRRVLTI